MFQGGKGLRRLGIGAEAQLERAALHFLEEHSVEVKSVHTSFPYFCVVSWREDGPLSLVRNASSFRCLYCVALPSCFSGNHFPNSFLFAQIVSLMLGETAIDVHSPLYFLFWWPRPGCLGQKSWWVVLFPVIHFVGLCNLPSIPEEESICDQMKQFTKKRQNMCALPPHDHVISLLPSTKNTHGNEAMSLGAASS